MSDADATVEKLRALISTRQPSQRGRVNRTEDSALRMTLWDFHNQVPGNLEVFEIWQALNSSKRDPERFENNVARLTNFLRSYRSPKRTPPPSQPGTARGGEGARVVKQDGPGSDIIAVHSSDLPETTRSQVPIPQPVGPTPPTGPTHADYIEVQDMNGEMPQMSQQNSNHAHCQYTGILHL
jgi:hypothetical protein